MSEIEYKGFVIKTEMDTDSPSPREDMDNMGTMICFHKNYNIGDKTTLKSRDFDGWKELELHLIESEGAVVVMPVFGYDHGGMSISTSRSYPYNCPWDSGMLGYIYATAKQVKAWMMIEDMNDENLVKIRNALAQEVETYNTWMTNGCVMYSIEREQPYDCEDDYIDACGGYYSEESAIEDAKSSIDYIIKTENEKLSSIRSPIELYAFIAGDN